MIRVALVLCLLLPIIYLLLNYSDSHKKINDVYHSKFAARKSRNVPVLIDGELIRRNLKVWRTILCIFRVWKL